ncbi:MAG TPA: 50S ribosomal protein L24 [Spirochaetota bacterium]|nr:50S ribosomal protein L24 [Spirochaetota bacterium]
METLKKLKKEDLVEIVVGKDKGKSGKIIEIDRKNNKVLIEGLNMIKKTQKKSNKNPNGGITEIEAFIDHSNVMIVCPKCKKSTRVGLKVVGDSKKRICKKCKSEID